MNKKPLTVRLDARVLSDVQQMADRFGTTVTKQVEIALGDYLKDGAARKLAAIAAEFQKLNSSSPPVDPKIAELADAATNNPRRRKKKP